MTTLIPKFDLKNGGSVPTGAINRSIYNKLADQINIKDFGAVGDGITNDTTAIQAAINYAITIPNSCLNIGNGDYLVSHLVIENASGLTINGTGALIGVSSGSYESVLTIKNSTGISVIGNLGVSGSYNTGYACGIAVYADTTSAQYIVFNNVNMSGVKLAWQFGSTSHPDALVSEITVYGGYIYGVPSAILVQGSETVVSFVGSILQTGLGTNPSGWSSLPRIALQVIGGYITYTSGALGITDSSTGLLVSILPLASTALGNIYGGASLVNVGIESESQYCVISNPSSLTPINPASAGAQTRFIGCSGYHALNSFPMVVIGNDYPGSIVFTNNNFYCSASRTLVNINAAANTICNIYCDEQSFGYNFLQGLYSIQGGNLHFTRRMILQVSNCNGQSLPSGTQTTLVWTSFLNTGDTQRFASNYSTSTGIFTVPAGGLKSVALNFVVRTTQPTYILSSSILINGSSAGYIPTMMGGANNGGFLRAEIEIGDLTAGTTIAVGVTQTGITSATNAGVYENMTIIARN